MKIYRATAATGIFLKIKRYEITDFTIEEKVAGKTGKIFLEVSLYF